MLLHLFHFEISAYKHGIDNNNNNNNQLFLKDKQFLIKF